MVDTTVYLPFDLRVRNVRLYIYCNRINVTTTQCLTTGTATATVDHCENLTSPSPGAPISLTEPGP